MKIDFNELFMIIMSSILIAAGLVVLLNAEESILNTIRGCSALVAGDCFLIGFVILDAINKNKK